MCMNLLKILFLLVLVISLVSCKKETSDQNEEIPSEQSGAYERILAATGCKVKDAASIEIIDIHKDSIDKTTYLFGSRKINDKERFWFSKYDPDGNLLWDNTINSSKEGLESHAYYFNQLTESTIATFEMFKRSSIDVVTTRVLLIDAGTGEVTATVDVDDGVFSSMYNMRESFLIYNTKRELEINSKASISILHFDYSGNIINPGNGISYVPEEGAFVLDNTLFLTTKTPFIITDLYRNTYWSAGRNSTELSIDEFKDEILSLSYKNQNGIIDTVIFDVRWKQVIYTSEHTSGETPGENSVIGEIGKEYVVSDGLTVSLTSFDKVANGSGTTYFKIAYTLKNNTTNVRATEGTFQLQYKNTSNYLQQYGFFNTIFPGEQISRTYEFKELDNVEMSYLRYVPSRGASEVNQVELYWKVPNTN